MMKKLKSETYRGHDIDFKIMWNALTQKYDKSVQISNHDGYMTGFYTDSTKEQALENAKIIIDEKEDYMKKDNRINLVRKNSDNHYSLQSDSTVYVSFKKAKSLMINISELKTRRNMLIKELRANGVKVNQKNNTDLLRLYEDKYYEELDNYRELEIKVQRKFDKIYEDGLYSPTIDNKELNEAIELSWELTNALNRNRPISIINEIKIKVDEIESNIGEYKKYSMVAI
jgi:glutamine synthetase type III